MKVRYNKDISFELPDSYNLEERLELINKILKDQEKLFVFSDDGETKYDHNIRRVLDWFSYYLCTHNKLNENGKQLRKDSEIIRKKRKKNIQKRELPLFDYYI